MIRRKNSGLFKIVAFMGGATLMIVMILMLASCASNRPQARTSSDGHKGLRLIHFASDSDLLDSRALDNLEYNLSWINNHPDSVLILEGHCDEWGDAAYNLQLGDRRARRVKANLIDMGADPERLIMVVSYGERRPLDTRHTKDAWRQNRRVEFIIR